MLQKSLESMDGTSIAYGVSGTGPTVILVGGGLADRSENAAVAEAIAVEGCTVINYDRRSRGASGEGEPGLALELADLGALVETVSGPLRLVGVSSGGALALEFAANGTASTRLSAVLVYEVPYLTSEDLQRAWAAYVPQLSAALRDADPDRALELFMGLAGSDDADIAAARTSPYWPQLRDLAPTLAHDAAVLGDGRIPDRVATIAVPVVVATGGAESAMAAFYESAASELVSVLPRGRRLELANPAHTLQGQSARAIVDALEAAGDRPGPGLIECR